MIGARSAARRSAIFVRWARPAARPASVLIKFAGVPSFLPRAFAAASALRVRSPDQSRLKLCDRHHLSEQEAPGRPLDLGKVAKAYLHASIEQLAQEGHGPGEAGDVRDN